MNTLQLDQEKFPTLSTWETKLLGEILEDSARKANPSKTEITQKDLLWAATMLEMDLQAQSGAIPQYPEDEENLRLEHNKKMLQKMKQQNIPWAESYPGELYPIEDQEI